MAKNRWQAVVNSGNANSLHCRGVLGANSVVNGSWQVRADSVGQVLGAWIRGAQGGQLGVDGSITGTVQNPYIQGSSRLVNVSWNGLECEHAKAIFTMSKYGSLSLQAEYRLLRPGRSESRACSSSCRSGSRSSESVSESRLWTGF